MNRPEASDPAASAAGADQWAKAVVDGMPSEDNTKAPSGEGQRTEAANGEGQRAQAGPAADEADVIDADISDVDVSGVDVTDADVTDTDVTDAEVVEAEIVEAEVAPPGGPGSTDEARAADEENPVSDISVEDLVIDLERVTTERDQYLDASRRLQAEFENYKKQVLKREVEARERANDSLVGELLPVLDAFDGAIANGAGDVEPMRASFLDAMAKHGLERIDPADAPFDPTVHEAVMHEEASDVDGPVVAEVMRAGYVWKGRVLRPAMVRTRG